MKQFLITPAAGKRLIAKALVTYSPITDALKNGTVVIVAGTTNGYVAEEILTAISQSDDFSRKRFFRGVVLPPSKPRSDSGRLYDDTKFFGDVVIKKGVWQKGLTIYDVVDRLKEGDVILKGANSLDLTRKKAAIYIGHPEAGTIGAALPVVVGRRVRLIIPVGVEKRVSSDLDDIAKKLNIPGLTGPRLLPISGEVFTEFEALNMLCNVKTDLIAGGGVSGAEGSVWLGITGDDNSLEIAERVIKSVSFEEPFNI
ncbi:hypothetical protein [Methanobacterium sp. SMA-27]|uniref:hypothetical protein n=1 Tax=Methanobacterium sp. SMA-27 TaxID=1495336 RepID=UPI00064EABEA|nr:hypothetical protein [Methanobacterium sp. SMA-27]